MQDLTILLEKLSEKLGTTVDQLMEVLMDQVGVQIHICTMWQTAWLILGILCVASIIFLFIRAIISNFFDIEDAYVFCIIPIILLVVSVIGWFVCYSELLTLEQNPKYWVIKKIFGAIN